MYGLNALQTPVPAKLISQVITVQFRGHSNKFTSCSQCTLHYGWPPSRADYWSQYCITNMNDLQSRLIRETKLIARRSELREHLFDSVC